MILFKWIKKTVLNLVSLGTNENQSALEMQMIKMLNASCLIAMLFIVPYPILSILILKIKLYFIIVLFPILSFLFYIFLLVLTSKGFIDLAKNFFLIGSFIFLWLLTTYLGNGSGMHLYLIPSVVVPFFILKKENKKLLIFSVMLVLIGFFLAWWYNSNFSPLVELEPVLLEVSYLINSGFVLIWFMLMGYSNYRLSNMAQEQLEEEKQKSENLLLNILPEKIATELKDKGQIVPQYFDSVTVLFTDFHGFTKVAESMSPKELVSELDKCFSYFDSLMDRYNLEKLKTIGDSYMCAGGLPNKNETHFLDTVLAALEIQRFMNQMKEIRKTQGSKYWELRLGIHTGHLVAGVIGQKKFAYDIWGDTVNTASRMESSGMNGKINISQQTYELVKEYFQCEYRGMVVAKNKGEVGMYFVSCIRPQYSVDGKGIVPNKKLMEILGKKV